MATITNSRTEREKQAKKDKALHGPLVDLGVDFVDDEPEQRIFSDDYHNHNAAFVEQTLIDSSGALPVAVEEHFEDVHKEIKTKKMPWILDWKTTNKSFLDLHKDLKRLGIKNNTFFLRLYDKDLQGIDPYSAILPLELQLKIILECIRNPWYYLREVCRIPVDGKPIEPGGGTQYRIDRNNLATWYLFLNGIDHYASKPRQTGKTQDAIAKLNYAYHFGAISATILFFNKDAGLAKENLARMKDQRDLLPQYMQMKMAFNEEGGIDKEIDNITTMKNPITKCQVKVMPRATSKDNAMRIGRGYTSSIMFFDEFDFINHNITIIEASVYAYSTASQNAEASSSVYGRLFTSTPGDLSDRDGEAATNYINGTKDAVGMLKWDDHMFDTPIDELKKIVHSTSYNGVVFVEHSWKQLKKSMAWYEKQCNLVAYKQEVILREIDLKRLRGSSLSPFTKDQQLYLASHVKTPKYSVDFSNKLAPFQIYEDLHRNYPYILAIDPADGLSEDNNAVTLINPYTQRAAAEFKCSYISQKELFLTTTTFMDRYCPLACVVIENNKGREIIQYFMDSRYRANLWVDEDKLNQILSTNLDKYGGVKQGALARKVQGLNTNTRTRDLMMNILATMVNERIDDLYTDYIVSDILNLIRKPTTGKIEAGPGLHDDNIMSYLIGLCVYFNASNLEKYGIKRGVTDPNKSAAPMSEAEQVSAIKQKIASAIDLIPDEYRDLFQGVLDAKDTRQEARVYATEVAQEKKRQEELLRKVMGGDDLNPFSDEAIELDRKKQLDQGLYNYGPPGVGSDVPTEGVRAALERRILNLNFEPQTQPGFNMDDWI